MSTSIRPRGMRPSCAPPWPMGHGSRALALNTSFLSLFDVPRLRGAPAYACAVHRVISKPWLLAEREECRENDFAFWCVLVRRG